MSGIPTRGKNMTRERFPLSNDSILWLIPRYEAGDADYRAVNILEAGDVSRIRLYLENPLGTPALRSLYPAGPKGLIVRTI
jgi:hypothetical protein